MSKLIINIDASSLKSLNCFRRYWNKYVLHKRPEGDFFNDTELGSAWHIFRNILSVEKDEAKAVSAALQYFNTRATQGMVIRDKKDYLNVEYLTQLCMRYLHKFGKEKSFGKNEYLLSPIDSKPLVEQSFSIKMFENDVCVINLQGTIDEFTIHPAGYIVIGDDKTTSKWDHKKFLRSFGLKPQLRFYRLALLLLSEQKGGDWFKELLSTHRVGCRINAIFLKPEIAKVEFEQSDVFFFSDEDLLELRLGLKNLIEHIANGVMHSPDVIPAAEGILNETCENSYCEFQSFCSKPEQVYTSMLDRLPSSEYSPLSFRKL